jgi:hypothetical protein
MHPAARIVERARVVRPQLRASGDHRGLDLHRVQGLEAFRGEQNMRGEAGAEAMLATWRALGTRNCGSAPVSVIVISSTLGPAPSTRTAPSDLPLVRSAISPCPAVTLNRGGLAVEVDAHLLAAVRRQQHVGAIDARGQVQGVEVHAEHGNQHRRHRHRCGNIGARRGAPRCAAQQHHPQGKVERRAGDDQPLQAEQRQAEMDGDQHAGDGAGRVGGVDLADGALARAAAQERHRNERQRHAGAERRREHHGQADGVAHHVEREIAALAARERLQRELHELEARHVHRQRGERGDAHRHLHPAEQAHAVRRGLDAAPYPQAAEGDAENERRQHQLESVRRAAQHQREHADPADLVHERGQAGERRDREQQPADRNRGRRVGAEVDGALSTGELFLSSTAAAATSRLSAPRPPACRADRPRTGDRSRSPARRFPRPGCW